MTGREPQAPDIPVLASAFGRRAAILMSSAVACCSSTIFCCMARRWYCWYGPDPSINTLAALAVGITQIPCRHRDLWEKLPLGQYAFKVR